MSRQSRVAEILERMLESNETPEEACAQCPDLLPIVRQRWSQLHGVEAKLNTFFPAPPSSGAYVSTQLSRRTQKQPEISGYDIGEVLGRGAVGVVYKARHLKLNRNVALKMLLSGIYASATELKRFVREAESIASLLHTNFVQVYEVGDLEGCPYFTMELVEGGSLSQKLKGVPLPAKQAAALIKTLAAAMQVAHASGIIHRDLKPSNILLTSDGIPKIGDFGLARRIEATSDLTHSGDRIGTPCYMAPEQAKGRSNTVGPLADVYSLGAILYELLTGRPPFQGETPGETERQLLSDEPVAPSRLNSKVPVDLETICLKCLEKDAGRRYASTGALGEDLRRYLEGEPITARPVRRIVRVSKWARRRPAQAVALASVSVLALALATGGLWLAAQRSAITRAAQADLHEADQYQERSEWPEASAALERATLRLGAHGPSALLSRLELGSQNLKLVARLESLHLASAQNSANIGIFGHDDCDSDYEAAFRDAGLGSLGDPPEAVAARVRASLIRAALVSALDDWSCSTTDEQREAWVLKVARLSDPVQTAWKDRARDPKVWSDRAALAEVTNSAPFATAPVSLLAKLGGCLDSSGGDSVRFLKLVQSHHQGDYWANIHLASALEQHGQSTESFRFYQAAIAIRPDVAMPHIGLATALDRSRQFQEAIEHCRIAVSVEPNSVMSWATLGNCLADARQGEAVDAFNRAVRLNPQYPGLRIVFAIALGNLGRHAEAIEQYRAAVALEPNFVGSRIGLIDSLIRIGHAEQGWATWKALIDSDPPEHAAWNGYAELCVFLGHADEYRQARHAMLRRFGDTDDPNIAARVGQACLLLPGSAEELRAATALVERAVSADKSKSPPWSDQYFQFARGIAEYRNGRMESAISIMQGQAAGVMGPAPRLIVAMAQYRLGQVSDARKTFASAIVDYDWPKSQGYIQEVWTRHVLRREAEAMILPQLPDFIAGKYQPRDNDERLGLLGFCEFNGLQRTIAGLYYDAFAADPKLADDLSCSHRFNAACAAVTAACGQSADSSSLSTAERTQWRMRALDWLKSDLIARTAQAAHDPTANSEKQKEFARWLHDPALHSVRDPDALNYLDADERALWIAFWTKVPAEQPGLQKR
jgi:tetratricopeptide (TPR) repeat protein/tRNA A-37 threonylcarbamoyl transferase component Bud32